ncbi:uncharacterized protein BDW43DRAFT_291508, partial [Aspergillus alliaceus]|uniref:uncharacterized protein n=1 Tax=Petromyces alliaceus TaxID=209559 RepID=UPI0012A64349
MRAFFSFLFLSLHPPPHRSLDKIRQASDSLITIRWWTICMYVCTLLHTSWYSTSEILGEEERKVGGACIKL